MPKLTWARFRWLGMAALSLQFCVAGHAQSGLTELLAKARQYDADYLGAAAARDAGLQARVAGRALLLPSSSVTYEVGNSEISRDYLNGATPLNYGASSRTLSWRLSQPLFSLERWAAFKEEDARSVLAELKFVEASTELTLRLARSVFDNLLALDNLKLAQAQHQTLVAQRREAENLRTAGVLTLTEVEDTRARELSSRAGELEAEFGVQMRRRELARMVGEIGPNTPASLPHQSLGPAQPDNLEYWLEKVQDANPKVVSATVALDLAGHALARARAGYYPSVDLIASTTRTQNPNNYTSIERSGGVSVRVTVPLYEGGRTDAGTARATALREQARQELDATRREAEIKATEAFLGLANASAKTRALQQALTAAQTSLKGATIGRDLGLRTHTEVLNAQQQVFAVQRDLSKERYNHALAALQLRALVGQLTDAELAFYDQQSTAEP